MGRKPNPNKKVYKHEEIDKLARLYKETGDRAAIAELFTAFQGYICKFATFLLYGKYNKADKDLQGLIRMMCPKNDTVHNRLRIIQQTLRGYEYEDIIGELNILFMDSVLLFKKRKDGPPFAGFLYSYFKFKVKKWLDKKLKDVLNNVAVEKIDEEDEKIQMMEISKEFENSLSTDKPLLKNIDRWIIHMYYYKNMSDKKIGDLVGMSGNWICMQRRKIISELKELGIDNVKDIILQNRL